MTRHGFTNIDSRDLCELSSRIGFATSAEQANADRTALLRIAGNLQRLDEANQILSNNRTYEQGVADAEARMRRRSNILENPAGEDDTGRAILAQIDKRVAAGDVRKYELGERALDDKPDKFNAPLRRKPVPAKATPAIDLDLDFLSDM